MPAATTRSRASSAQQARAWHRWTRPPGTLVAFATAPGSVASDGIGKNGIYTQHLLASLGQPGVPVEQVFKRVRVGVMKDTRNAQVPWESSSLVGDFYFKPGAATPTATDPAAIELAYWGEHKGLHQCRRLQELPEEIPQRPVHRPRQAPGDESAQARDYRRCLHRADCRYQTRTLP